jgi:hypothetical protein
VSVRWLDENSGEQSKEQNGHIDTLEPGPKPHPRWRIWRWSALVERGAVWVWSRREGGKRRHDRAISEVPFFADEPNKLGVT